MNTSLGCRWAWSLPWAWLYLWAWLCGGVACKQCVTVDPCRCEMDDGSGTVDISPVGRTDGVPTFKDVPSVDGFQYSYNPCYSFTEGTCEDASVCQSSVSGYWKAGDQASAMWSFDGDNVQVTYTYKSDLDRKSEVTWKCDPTAEEASLTAHGDVSMGDYVFDVTSKYACPGAVASVISGGSILLIVFFAVLVVYLVAGIVFQRVQRQATGSDVIPNKSFWWALPGLVKTGFLFTLGCVRRDVTYDKI